MTVHQIIYLCHTFIIQLHLSQIHPTKMKSKFENPHQTKQKLILQPPNPTPLKPTPPPTKRTNNSKPKILIFFSPLLQKTIQKLKFSPTQAPPIRTFSGQFKIQNLKYFFSLPLQKQFPKYQAFPYTNPTKNNSKNANFPYTLSEKQLLQKLKNHNDSPRPKISLILP